MKQMTSSTSRLRWANASSLIPIASIVIVSMFYVNFLRQRAQQRNEQLFRELPHDLAGSFSIVASNADTYNGLYRIDLINRKWSRIADQPFWTAQRYFYARINGRECIYHNIGGFLELIDLQTMARYKLQLHPGCDNVELTVGKYGNYLFEYKSKKWTVSSISDDLLHLTPVHMVLSTVKGEPWLQTDPKHVIFADFSEQYALQLTEIEIATGTIHGITIEPQSDAVHFAADPTTLSIRMLNSRGLVTEFKRVGSAYVPAKKIQLKLIRPMDEYQGLLCPPSGGWMLFQVLSYDEEHFRPIERACAYNLASHQVFDCIGHSDRFYNSHFIGAFNHMPK